MNEEQTVAEVADTTPLRDSSSIQGAPIGTLVMAAARRMETVTIMRSKSMSVRPPATGIVHLLGTNPGLRQTEVAQELRMDASTLGRYIDRLEQRGMLTRLPVPSDRRAWALHLTDEGRDVFRLIDAVVQEVDGEVRHRMSQRNFDHLRELLSQFLDVTADI